LVTRREAIVGLGLAGLGVSTGRAFLAAPGDIRFGYAAITWQGKDDQAIEDAAAVGFRGIQLRSNVLEQFADKPAALRDKLTQHHLPMIALSSGNLRQDPAVEKEELATHTSHAQFVRDLGGSYLQVIDERPKGRTIERGDYARLGRLLTELGKRTGDLGIPLVYHHHMNSLGERPDEIAPILDASDGRHVKLLLDVAHWQQGGGDPVKAVTDYADRIGLLHLKDVQSPAPGATGDLSRSYRFVELGRGSVDLPGVFAALDKVRYRGWAIVELDRVPEPGRTPKESALINKRYLEARGFTI
jgi:inosose dehydratase